MNKYKTVKELVSYLKKQDIVNKFVVFAEKNGLKRRNLLIKKSSNLLNDYLLSNIVDDILGIEASIIFVNDTDPAIEQALQHLKQQ